MIVVRLMGGLGNQLFQYAAGRHLAHLNNTELYADISFLKSQEYTTPRYYELGAFNVACTVADDKMLDKFNNSDFSKKERVLTHLLSFGKNKKYKFDEYGFDENLLELRGNFYIRGYFQSEKYFRGINDIIRRELTIKEEFIPKDTQLIEQIKNTNSIAIHIRRGDYIRNLSSMEAHGLCSKDYYAKSIEFMKREVGEDVHFYLFTDDEAWVKNEMKWNINSTLISGKTTVEDFYLMNLCKHNIIANSTFSWWAAWLNNHPAKKVIAPKHWTNNLQTEFIELVPKNWIIK
ncbi:MAG: alpha,2-fucosyltransferase [Bacteroidota bacterium]|nr:alpha,2-fucosyltransferase [Bacteroidota bacterium]